MEAQTIEFYYEVEDAYDDLKDHNYRVEQLCFKFCKFMNLDDSIIKDICYAAQYHDVGKLFIPKNILNKKSKLSDDEFSIMKLHSTYSYKVLKMFNVKDSICNMVKHHHESVNGRGYPDGLRDDSIPFGAKVIKICDVFDALTNDRIYRKKFFISEALEIMENESYMFNKEIFDMFKLFIN